MGLNGVRPRRPEQYAELAYDIEGQRVSMESGLEDRNNVVPEYPKTYIFQSQWSPA